MNCGAFKMKMSIHGIFPLFKLWKFRIIMLDMLMLLKTLPDTDACQSFTTIEVTEHSAERRNHETPGSLSDRLFISKNGSPFSVNLTDLLWKNLHLTDADLQAPIFFADAEQSRPFKIQQRSSQTDQNYSASMNRWYQLFSSAPIDREQLCNVAKYPERVALANTCCAKAFQLPNDVVISPMNQPCCIFLGITVASKGTHVLRIQILDVNDNAPKFGILHHPGNVPYFANLHKQNVIGISEASPQGSWIPIPTAIDSDEGLNGAVRYSLQPLNDNALWTDYFKLLNNVRTAELPRNSTCVSFVINNQKTLNTFEMNDYSGPGLLIVKSLDREKISSFGFNLLATDLGTTVQHSSFMNIRIVILDENDNAPVFEKSNYQVEIRENQAGVSLMHAKVHDADAESNGRLSYFMQPSRLDLSTGKSSGVSADFLRTHIQLVPVSDGVTLRVSQPLDYEKQTEFTFELIAVDHGQPALSATAHVNVNVLNVNDHAPLIRFYYHGVPLDRDYARLSVLEQHESTAIVDNQLICHVHVTDADSEFESISCTVESTERNFFLREVSTNRLIQRSKIYELLSATRLDREVHARLLILVRCQDGKAARSLASQNQLQLILLDVNDHPPVFSQDHYHGSVPENAANTLVNFISPESSPVDKNLPYGVHAKDADSGMNALVFYSIVPWELSSSNMSNFLSNNKTENKLNKTSYDSVGLGNLPNELKADQSMQRHPWNPRDDAEKFYIDQTGGQIRTRVALDCEEQQLYRFLVLAVDQSEKIESRYTATARVTISVRDENDNPPVIEQRHYAFAVNEGLPRHTRIGRIQSVDADVGSENRRTIYELKNEETFNASEFILIEAHTGYIRTRQVLDREQTNQISFIVLARNEQPVHEVFRSKQTILTEKGPTFFDEVSVTVTVEDDNDNAPMLISRIPNPSISSREIAPTVIDLTFKLDPKEKTNLCIEFPFQFVDDDEGPNADIDVLLEPNPFFEFRLDNTLLCKTATEQPTVGQMNLFVTVQDKPLNRTKSLKRQYTIRIRFVQDILPNKEVNQYEHRYPSRFISNPTLFPRTNPIEPASPNEKSLVNNPMRQSPDPGQPLHEIPSRDSRKRKPLSSSSTTVTIVAILVAVSGLLCILLLGVVFALRKSTPHGQNMNPDIANKTRDDEDGDNSVLSGQRGDAQHICFTARHSPIVYQTASAGDRFHPISQAYLGTKGSLDQRMAHLAYAADAPHIYTPGLHLLNNQVKSWNPPATVIQRELLHTPGYHIAAHALQTESSYEVCEDNRTAGTYTKSSYSPLQIKSTSDATPSEQPDDMHKFKSSSCTSRGVDTKQPSSPEASDAFIGRTDTVFIAKPSSSEVDVRSMTLQKSSKTTHSDRENFIGNDVFEMSSRLPCGVMTPSECMSAVTKDTSPGTHVSSDNRSPTRSPKNMFSKSSFV